MAAVICYLFYVIGCLLFVVCYLLFVIFNLLFVVCYLLFVICYLIFVICKENLGQMTAKQALTDRILLDEWIVLHHDALMTGDDDDFIRDEWIVLHHDAVMTGDDDDFIHDEFVKPYIPQNGQPLGRDQGDTRPGIFYDDDSFF